MKIPWKRISSLSSFAPVLMAAVLCGALSEDMNCLMKNDAPIKIILLI